MLISADTHCHLNFHAFDADRESVLLKARQAGINKIVIPGTDLVTSQQALDLATSHKGFLFAGVGIHPNDCQSWNEDHLEYLNTLTRHEGVVAIGEIGLDYYRMHNPVDIQRKVLEQQLILAEKTGFPVILHNRQSTGDLLSILSSWVGDLRLKQSPLAQRPGVLHSYDGSFEDAQRAIQLGFRLGITGPITFRNSSRKREMLAMLPLEFLLVETDAPYLTPEPYRGRRNEPAYIPFIINELASVFQTTSEEIAEKTTYNANVLFGWGD